MSSAGISGADARRSGGYINLARDAGLSPARDTSSCELLPNSSTRSLQTMSTQTTMDHEEVKGFGKVEITTKMIEVFFGLLVVLAADLSYTYSIN